MLYQYVMWESCPHLCVCTFPPLVHVGLSLSGIFSRSPLHMFLCPCGMRVQAVYLLLVLSAIDLHSAGLWHGGCSCGSKLLYPALNNVCWKCVCVCSLLACSFVWVGVEALKGKRCGAGQVKCARMLRRVLVLAVGQHRSLPVNTAIHSWAGLIDCTGLCYEDLIQSCVDQGL